MVKYQNINLKIDLSFVLKILLWLTIKDKLCRQNNNSLNIQLFLKCYSKSQNTPIIVLMRRPLLAQNKISRVHQIQQSQLIVLKSPPKIKIRINGITFTDIKIVTNNDSGSEKDKTSKELPAPCKGAEKTNLYPISQEKNESMPIVML